jgi:hypothetical protein
LALAENGPKVGPCADIVPTGCVVTASCPLLNMQINPLARIGLKPDDIGAAFDD